LEAKLFGGASVVKSLSPIGRLNAEFAKRFLATEGIRIVGESLGDERGRRVEYRPVSGHARQLFVEAPAETIEPVLPAPVASAAGAIELF
jgi:chemotaxis protein CheD